MKKKKRIYISGKISGISLEALHATIDISEAIGADVSAEEWGCYLIGYICHCIEKTLNEKKKKTGK